MNKPDPDASRPCPLCRGIGKPTKSKDTDQWYRCRECGMKFKKAKAPDV